MTPCSLWGFVQGLLKPIRLSSVGRPFCTTRVWESNPHAWGIEPRCIPPRLQAFALCPRNIGAVCRNRTGSSSPYGALPSGSGLHHTTTPHMRPSFRAVIGCRRAPHITENMARVPWYARFFRKNDPHEKRVSKKRRFFVARRRGAASRQYEACSTEKPLRGVPELNRQKRVKQPCLQALRRMSPVFPGCQHIASFVK